MAPKLRVLAGTSPSTLVPITHLVNTSQPHHVSSDLFEGQIVAHIHGLIDEHGVMKESEEYFNREDRKGVTWSIQVQGRFLKPYSANDILFGNTFDRPLKLPWGTSAVLKFMHYIDPTLEHDLMSPTKPWALSPLIATMPYFAHMRLPAASDPPFPPKDSIIDSTGDLYLALVDDDSSTASSGSDSALVSPASSASSLASAGSKGSIKAAIKKAGKSKSKKDNGKRTSKWEKELQHLDGASQRRGYFASEKKRAGLVFGEDDLITTDFCYGFINFAPSLSLQLPGGLSFDLMRYWDGQPVRFVCCERKGSGEAHEPAGGDDEPWGRIFWCVAIEVADDGDGDA